MNEQKKDVKQEEEQSIDARIELLRAKSHKIEIDVDELEETLKRFEALEKENHLLKSRFEKLQKAFYGLLQNIGAPQNKRQALSYYEALLSDRSRYDEVLEEGEEEEETEQGAK